MKRTGPIASSTLLPKIHRNSMLPPMCRMPPCMNIELKTVAHVGGWSPRSPPQTTLLPAIPHSSPGWVTS